MQESNFEKQAQQKMEELGINPSAGVWEKIAVAIQRKKRGRRALIWGSFVIILIVTAFISWFSNTGKETFLKTDAPAQENYTGKNNNNIKDKKNIDYKQGLSNNKKAVLKEGITTTAAIPVQSNKALHQQKTFKPNQYTKYPRIGADLTDDFHGEKNNTSKDKDSRKVKSKNIAYTNGPKTTVKITASQPAEFNDKNVIAEEDMEGEAPGNDSLLTLLIAPVEIADTTAERNNDLPVVAVDVVKSAPPDKPETKKVHRSKWEFGANFSLGMSATRNSYLGIDLFEENKAYDQLTSVGGNNGGSGSSTGYSPSAIRSRPGLMAGVFVQRAISPKMSILTGLSYKLYSTKMAVGNRIDSLGSLNSFRSYYRAGSKSNYINRFHFIAVPVSLEWSISNLQKRPIYLSAGLTLSKLINSSALQFNPSTGVYFQDNSLFNTTQVDLSIRFLFALNKRQPQSFLIGPDLSYSISRMATTALYSGRNYSYLGLHLKKSIVMSKH